MLGLAAFLSLLAWRFSFRLRDAAFLLPFPPLSFFAIGASLRTACDDGLAPFCHMGTTWPHDRLRQFGSGHEAVRM